MATVEITINDEGQIVSKVKGVKGKSCTDVDKFVKDLGEVVSDKKTGEFFEKEEDKNTLKVRS